MPTLLAAALLSLALPQGASHAAKQTRATDPAPRAPTVYVFDDAPEHNIYCTFPVVSLGRARTLIPRAPRDFNRRLIETARSAAF